MQKQKWNIVADAFLICLSGGAFVSGLNLDEQGGFLPRVVSAIIFLLSVWDLIAAIISKDRESIQIEVKRVLIILAFIIGYVLAIWILGYYIATFIFIAGCMYWLGVRSWPVLLLVPIGFLLIAYFGFVKFLYFRPISIIFLR